MGCMNYSEDASNSASNSEDAPIGEVRLITRDYGICERCVWTILPITAAVAIRVDWCVIFTTLYAALPCILSRTLLPAWCAFLCSCRVCIAYTSGLINVCVLYLTYELVLQDINPLGMYELAGLTMARPTRTLVAFLELAMLWNQHQHANRSPSALEVLL